MKGEYSLETDIMVFKIKYCINVAGSQSIKKSDSSKQHNSSMNIFEYYFEQDLTIPPIAVL